MITILIYMKASKMSNQALLNRRLEYSMYKFLLYCAYQDLIFKLKITVSASTWVQNFNFNLDSTKLKIQI